MRIIKDTEWRYLRNESGYFYFERRKDCSQQHEVIMITSAKYIVGKDTVLFLCWVDIEGGKVPSITYSYSTQRRINNGEIIDTGLIPRLLRATEAQAV